MTDDITPPTEPQITFADLDLSDPVLNALSDAGYVYPTPIQAGVIPIILQGRDVIGVAQTGTGKTGSFVLPMIEILANSRARARMPRSLILAPTRELAAQIADNFTKYTKYQALNVALLVGGESMGEQIKLLDRGVDVLIATPGRMLDLFKQGKIILSDVKVFIVDECDRMLDMGFIPDIEEIAGALPGLRQTLMFSATMAPEIRKLAQKFLSNPKEIAVAAPASTAKNVTQSVVFTQENDKRKVLRALLKNNAVANAFIFCNRKIDADTVAQSLKKHGFPAAALHGDMTQSARTDTLNDFKADKVSLLVCSDVAARGLDIPAVAYVFNFGIPRTSEDYVHRIGRTGRAGQSGIAISIATPADMKKLADVETLIQQTLPELNVVGFSMTRAAAQEEFEAEAPRGRGQRGSGQRGDGKRTGNASSKPAAPCPERTIQPAHQPSPSSAPAEIAVLGPRLVRPASIEERPRQPIEQNNTVGFGDDMPAFLR